MFIAPLLYLKRDFLSKLLKFCGEKIHIYNKWYLIMMQDHVNNWRTTALVLTTIFFLAAIIWFIGDYFFFPVSSYHSPKSLMTSVLLLLQVFFFIALIDSTKRANFRSQLTDRTRRRYLVIQQQHPHREPNLKNRDPWIGRSGTHLLFDKPA